MRRGPTLALAALWLAALVGAVLAGLLGGWHVAAHAYFAAWLVAVSLPLGALPVLMALDLFGAAETASVAALRRLLAAMPIMMLLLVPVLFDLGAVFPWPHGSTLASSSLASAKGFGKIWYGSVFFGLRSVVYGLVWTALSLFFIRPAPRTPRHRLVAGTGLGLHLAIGTLAAYDWFMSLDQGFVSSSYGLVVIAAQAAFALTAALLVALLADGDGRPRRSESVGLLVVVVAAAYVQFSQYLVVWSANLPKEIVWYQTRWVGALGPIFVVAAPLSIALALVLLAPAGWGGRRRPVLVGLSALLAIECLDLACLASPRGTFDFAGLGIDLAFLIVVAGFGGVCAALLGERRTPAVRHG